MARSSVVALPWHIGDIVVKLRTIKGWKAGDLAIHADVWPNTISDLENGRNSRPDTLEKVAKALDTTIEEMRAMVPVRETAPRQSKGHPSEEVSSLRRFPRDPRETPPLSRIAAEPRDAMLGDIRAAREALTKAMELLDDALRRAGG